MLKGKQGRFRQNLLGKRVDYSGRSVIVTGPELKLHQCGLPKKMALELFKPFIYARLDARVIPPPSSRPRSWLKRKSRKSGISSTRSSANIRFSEPRTDAAPPGHPGLRTDPGRRQGHPAAPARLHGLQRRLRRRPDGCSRAAFAGSPAGSPRADDVDQQHSAPGQRRADHRSFAGHGSRPVLPIDHEPERAGRRHGLLRHGELHHALENKVVTLHAKIRGRFKSVDEEGKPYSKIYETTPGRMIIGELLPKNGKVLFDICNQEMTKKNISKMIDTVYRHCGQKDTVIFCDRIMQLGFTHACRAGISFGKDDMIIPETKAKIVGDTEALVKEYEQQYNDGLITQGEKYNKVVDAWGKATEKVAEDMMARIKAVEFDPETNRQKPMNAIYMMSHSGARGSPNQMRQLAACAASWPSRRAKSSKRRSFRTSRKA
ncbi:hypothetical protein Lal_00014467 [Lupinus albus]|nr:hypothetical protein Lal_00014467 [Lupinus albus]